MMSELELQNKIHELCKSERRFLGYAQLKTEGGTCAFDDGPPMFLGSIMVRAVADIYRKQKGRKRVNQKDIDKADAVVRAARNTFHKQATAWIERKTASKAA